MTFDIILVPHLDVTSFLLTWSAGPAGVISNSATSIFSRSFHPQSLIGGAHQAFPLSSPDHPTTHHLTISTSRSFRIHLSPHRVDPRNHHEHLHQLQEQHPTFGHCCRRSSFVAAASRYGWNCRGHYRLLYPPYRRRQGMFAGQTRFMTIHSSDTTERETFQPPRMPESSKESHQKLVI